jgi:hypothetical protein
MRMAFLATEGVFFLRYLGLVDFTCAEWKSSVQTISRSLPSNLDLMPTLTKTRAWIFLVLFDANIFNSTLSRPTTGLRAAR